LELWLPAPHARCAVAPLLQVVVSMRGGASVSLPPVLENLYNYLGALQVSLSPPCARVLVPISRVPAPC